LDGRGADG
jgi:allantoinase